MEDQLIIELFFERSEDAIRELSLKYEKMCRRLANKFLHNEQDIEECINDVYLAIWNTIPPQKPNPLGAYICRIAKNVALKKYRTNSAQKRNHYYDVILEEVDEFLSVNEKVESEIARANGKLANNGFLAKAPKALVDQEREKLNKYIDMRKKIKANIKEISE